MSLVQDSILKSTLGPWDSEGHDRPTVLLDPPVFAALKPVNGDSIHIRDLTPALRATGSASIAAACCRVEAQQAVEVLLDAHQRAMLAFEHSYHHSQSDSLVAARAALWQAIDGRDEPVLAYVERYHDRPDRLSEALQAVGMAAQERGIAGEHACRLWPQIMDRVLDAAETNPKIFTEHIWGGYAESALLPNLSESWHYLTAEITGESYPWRDLLSWVPQVERWLGAITCSQMSIDNLVVAVRELDTPSQIQVGLRWIESIAMRSGENCANTYSLPEWLRERRTDLNAEEQLAQWQRVVDLLVVAGDSRVSDLAD